MKRSTAIVWAALACGLTAAIAAPPALAATRCVGSKPGCFATVQAAVDGAQDGDTIAIAPGTYAGGVRVGVSVAIVGAGAGSTIIKGGGPVLTLGVAGAAGEPTISIAGVTITGGVATDDANVTFVAVGGGVFIPGSTSGVAGATVTIRNSVITGNRAAPASTTDGGEPCPGGVNCPFAAGFGGGIADVGKLTLINTTVSNNTAGGGLASNAGGGGTWTATNGGAGSLTLINSTVTGNTASVSAPNGEFASGGGIEVQDGEAFVVTGSAVSNNTANVTSSYPSSVGVFADSGGIHVGGLGTATIQGSRITGNVVSATDPAGAPGAGSAALGVGFSDFCVCTQTLVLKDTVISGNRTSTVGGDGSFAGQTLEIDTPATVTNTAVVGNSISVTSQTGAAFAAGAVFVFDGQTQPVVMRNTLISGNTVRASSGAGSASVQGAGLMNGGLLELHGVVVADNSGSARGSAGFAEGGGIWNGQPFGPDGAPTPSLLLDHTTVIGNALSASPGLSVQGGGLYTAGFPVSQAHSLIAHNAPDQCFGC
jgi:hypothetical protein